VFIKGGPFGWGGKSASVQSRRPRESPGQKKGGRERTSKQTSYLVAWVQESIPFVAVVSKKAMEPGSVRYETNRRGPKWSIGFCTEPLRAGLTVR